MLTTVGVRKSEKRHTRTSQVARLVGVHPNTVRLYEQWGFLQPVQRAANGYRLYTDAHVDQMRLARTAMHGGWPGASVRRSALSLVRRAASGDLGGALEQAFQHLSLVRAERAQAEAAAEYLARWAAGQPAQTGDTPPLSIGRAARSLSLTVDTLRSWERNGLIEPQRRPNGYRVYGPPEIGRLRVIRMLCRAGYSRMSILRFLSQLDRGEARSGDVRRILDTPRTDEEAMVASDRWLSTLAEHEQRARAIIAQLEEMIARRSD
jgi:DNA-binding transcriptional MerR regulator